MSARPPDASKARPSPLSMPKPPGGRPIDPPLPPRPKAFVCMATSNNKTHMVPNTCDRDVWRICVSLQLTATSKRDILALSGATFARAHAVEYQKVLCGTGSVMDVRLAITHAVRSLPQSTAFNIGLQIPWEIHPETQNARFLFSDAPKSQPHTCQLCTDGPHQPLTTRRAGGTGPLAYPSLSTTSPRAEHWALRQV